LLDVTFTRTRQDHVTLRLSAPSADLAPDGTQVVLTRPEGQAQDRPDGGRVHIRGSQLRASLKSGHYHLRDVTISDESGRALSTPILELHADGGLASAAPPVRLSGPNWSMQSDGPAEADLRTEEIWLRGPIQAQAWPSPLPATSPAPDPTADVTGTP
jgi:hypothetical protein